MTTPSNSLSLAQYPFALHTHITGDHLKQNYIDEGQGMPVLMLHGNPTWSYFFRNLIACLSGSGFRAIAPDHIGCGLSDKPEDWSYTLENHIRNIEHLVDEHLKLDQFDLIVHDWGGAIGMGYATRHPEKIRRLVILNSAAYLSQDCPGRIALCRIPFLGEFLLRGLNAFVELALIMAPARKLPPEVKQGYRFPYDCWKNRVAVCRFVQDIPLKKTHVTYRTLTDIQEKLPLLADKPIIFFWGMKDFCFHPGFLQEWRKFFPNAEVRTFDRAAHYLLDDEPDAILPGIRNFLQD